jgi:hypothetical protein
MLGDNYNSHLEGLKSSGYEVPDAFFVKKGESPNTKKYSDAATQQAKEALNDPSAPEVVKAKARKVLGL